MPIIPLGIIWNKTSSALMNYLMVIFSHPKSSGCFIYNMGFDYYCVKSTCGTQNHMLVKFEKDTVGFDEVPGGYFPILNRCLFL